MKKVVTIPKVNGYSLNKINNDLSTLLKDKGFYVSKHHPKGTALIQHYSKPLSKDYNFDKTYLIQPIDGTKINKNHIDYINSYDIIITPSEIGKRIMIYNGITKPIVVIPNYYEKDIKPSSFYIRSDKFTFYSESTGIIRKNIPNLLKYFLETFTADDNVRLVIKTNSDRVNELNSILSKYKDRPEVIIIGKYLSDEDLESIMSNIDCYICLSYMEGFCIPIINALKWGKKVIALNTEISGYGDFLNNENAYLVDCKRIHIDKEFESLLIWGEDSEWEEPDYEHYRMLLKQSITDNSKKSVDISRYYKDNIMNEYSNLIVDKMVENTIPNCLKEYYPTDEEICELLINSEFKEDVFKKIKNIKENEKYLVITFVDNKYYSIFEIFHKYYDKFNRKDLLVISLDKDVYTKISKLGINTILLPFNLSNKNYFWRYRLNIIKLIFEWSKMDIIHTDSDCIWIKDPIKYLLDNEYDLITQIEYGHPFYLSKKNGFVMCCGFMKFKYSEKGLNIFRDVMKLKINDDQIFFNEYLFRNILKIDTNKDKYCKSIELYNGVKIGILNEDICNRNNKFNNSYIFHPWLYPVSIKEKVSLLLKMLKKYEK